MPDLAKKSISVLVAAATVVGTFAATSSVAQARGLYIGSGVFGALALGAMAAEASAPRYARVVEHRYVRKNGKLHYCGCVVRDVPVYP